MKLLTFCGLIGLLVLSTSQITAQETESALPFNPEQVQRYEQEKKFPPREKQTGTSLSLPFVDDFSRYSLPTDDPSIPPDYQLWLDTNVFINNTLPISPPTQGVATFDGLGANGYPYNFTNEFAYGAADTLTSCPIDLSSFGPDDDVYLVFYYQAQGRGNAPEESDSLVLEFDIPGSTIWSFEWSAPGQQLGAFQRVFIPITDEIFFYDEFRFRFRNYATLSGAVDHWHLDYIYLNENVDPADFPLIDVSFVDPIPSFIQDFTAMPWTHFDNNAAANMLPGGTISVTNLKEESNNVTTSYRVLHEGSEVHTSQDIITPAFPGTSTQFLPFEVGAGSEAFVFPTAVADTCADFQVEFIVEVGVDDLGSNDTLRATQSFQNYYAYDDGTAEGAYSLQNSAGGQIAMRYDIEEPDTLLGLYVYFIPFTQDASNAVFILQAWQEEDGLPGEIFQENFSFQSPEYFKGANNLFTYYTYDMPIAVEGDIFVGWSQSDNNQINIGNDRNTASNATKLFFRTTAFGNWEASTASGSLMVRPVFASGKGTGFVGVEELQQLEATIFPNPVSDFVNIHSPNAGQGDLSIYSSVGQLVLQQEWSQGEAVEVYSLPAGSYMLLLRTEKGIIRKQFIK